jgi:hypothetical protein
MVDTSPNTGQWVTCPGCNAAVQRSSLPEKHSVISWLDCTWKVCSPACVQKVRKRKWWVALVATLTAACFTGSFVLTTLRSPTPMIRWTSLVILLLFWAVALAHWSLYRSVGSRANIA